MLLSWNGGAYIAFEYGMPTLRTRRSQSQIVYVAENSLLSALLARQHTPVGAVCLLCARHGRLKDEQPNQWSRTDVFGSFFHAA